MVRGKHVDPKMVGRILGMQHAGKSQQEIADFLLMRRSTVPEEEPRGGCSFRATEGGCSCLAAFLR